MNNVNKQEIPFFVGNFESHGTQTMFGCVVVDGEEIMLESSAYGIREGDLVIFNMGFTHKFKRAENVNNLNLLLESLNYYLFYNSDMKTSNKRNIAELTHKIKHLLSFTKTIPKFSSSAQRAYNEIINANS